MSFRVNVTWRNDNPKTIYAVLKERLKREPTNQELSDEVRRILKGVLG